MTIQNFSGDTILEIIKDLYKKTGGTPPSQLIETLIRQVDEERKRSETVKGWITNDGINVGTIAAQQTKFVISPARSIVFTETTNTSIPDTTYTTIDFIGVRGLINNQSPETYGCCKWVEGYTDRFTKQAFIPDRYPILFFGDFGFDTNTNGSREIYIEFFDKDDVSLGGYTFAQRAAPSDWTNFSFCFMSWFGDGDYCKFEVWQDSGSSLAIQSANFGFMLG